MRVTIYGIGGGLNEELAGTAHDPVTALNLLRLLWLTGSSACSLHGAVFEGQPAYSGEMSLEAADRLFREVRERNAAAVRAGEQLPY